MPNFKHVVKSEYKPTFRTEKVKGMFDLDVDGATKKEWDVNCPIENLNWQIGLIVGASGTGKTTLSKRMFGDDAYHHGFNWDKSSILDDFSKDIDVSDICSALTAVGFSSPPSWMLPYGVLSNGQKFRAEVARCMLEGNALVVFDEFTSVVDRQVAKVGSFAVQKFIRKQKGKQFVAVTCHYDVEEWLMPDWVYDVSAGEFRSGRLERRPPVNCEIFECSKEAWWLFKEHHYLTHSASAVAKWYMLTVDGKPAAITSTIHFPSAKHKVVQRGHRTVVLPDYQGLGLANALVEAVADMIVTTGGVYQTTTSHPAMIAHRCKSSKWRVMRKPSRVTPKQAIMSNGRSGSAARLTASFEYKGCDCLEM